MRQLQKLSGSVDDMIGLDRAQIVEWRYQSIVLSPTSRVTGQARLWSRCHWHQSQWKKRWTPKFNVAGWHQVNPVGYDDDWGMRGKSVGKGRKERMNSGNFNTACGHKKIWTQHCTWLLKFSHRHPSLSPSSSFPHRHLPSLIIVFFPSSSSSFLPHHHPSFLIIFLHSLGWLGVSQHVELWCSMCIVHWLWCQ